MRFKGMKASELIQRLQELIDSYGDLECIAATGDYPGGVGGVYLQEPPGNGYIPAGTFVVCGRS